MDDSTGEFQGRRDSQGREHPERVNPDVFQESASVPGRNSQLAQSAADLASQIPEVTIRLNEPPDKLTFRQQQALKKHERDAYERHEAKVDLRSQIEYFRARCELFEQRLEIVDPKLTELEACSRAAKGNTLQVTALVAIGSAGISTASQFLYDAVKWTVCGLGIGLVIAGLAANAMGIKYCWPSSGQKSRPATD